MAANPGTGTSEMPIIDLTAVCMALNSLGLLCSCRSQDLGHWFEALLLTIFEALLSALFETLTLAQFEALMSVRFVYRGKIQRLLYLKYVLQRRRIACWNMLDKSRYQCFRRESSY